MSQCVDKNYLEFNQIKTGVACISKLKQMSWLLFSISTVAECVPFPGHYRKLTSNPFLRACFHIFLVFSPCKQPITTYMYIHPIQPCFFLHGEMHYQREHFHSFFCWGFSHVYRHIVPYIFYMPRRQSLQTAKKKKTERQNRFLLISIYDQQSCYFHLNNSLFYIILCVLLPIYLHIIPSSVVIIYSYFLIILFNHLMTLT